MTDITLNDNTELSLHRLVADTRDWCEAHGAEIGVIEMAVGGALIAWGLQNGLIEMGTDLVATALADQGLAAKVGGAAGATVGSLPGLVLGSIGVAAGGTAIGIPAVIVIGGGAFILGSMGYTLTDIISQFLKPDLVELLTVSSVVLVGTALLIDGARRFVTDPRVLDAASAVAKGVLHLKDLTVDVLARTADELKAIIDSMLSKPESSTDAAGSTVGGVGGAATGAFIGSTLGAGAVTVLGSTTLGAAALSLGLVSAPVWPIVVGGAAGLGLGYFAWKAARRVVGGRKK